MPYYSGADRHPYYSLPPYWEAVIFGTLGLLAIAIVVLFAKDKPLARLWKVVVFALLMVSLSTGSIIAGNSTPGSPWIQPVAISPGHGYTALPMWLSISIYLLMGLFVVLLAHDYQWLTWVRLWLDAFVFNKTLPDTSPKPHVRR